jgi:hypothetical protein
MVPYSAAHYWRSKHYSKILTQRFLQLPTSVGIEIVVKKKQQQYKTTP